MKNNALNRLLVLLLFLCLAGCGQTGPLVTPPNSQAHPHFPEVD